MLELNLGSLLGRPPTPPERVTLYPAYPHPTQAWATWDFRIEPEDGSPLPPVAVVQYVREDLYQEVEKDLADANATIKQGQAVDREIRQLLGAYDIEPADCAAERVMKKLSQLRSALETLVKDVDKSGDSESDAYLAAVALLEK